MSYNRWWIVWSIYPICAIAVTIDQVVVPSGPPIPFARRAMKPNDKLLLVQVVWRHGDRAPVTTYPTDIHQEDAWPNGWGELTQLGMLQQYALGQVLRKRYITSKNPLLGKSYYAKEVFFRSTDVNRTLVSAYSNIAGMFSGGEAGRDYPSWQGWPTGWTPVPVHTMPVDDDHAGNIFASCPRAVQLDEELQESEEYRKLADDNKDFLEFLSNKTGSVVTLPTIYLLYDVHQIELNYNMSQPKWLTREVSRRLRNLTDLANEFVYGIGEPYTPELIRLRGGPMLRSIVDLMNHKLKCLSNTTRDDCSWIRHLKYHAFSAHDTTVSALLSTFGDELEVLRGGLPKYTASVVVELWSLEEGPAVRILFHRAFHHNYKPITHLTKGCPKDNEFCPLSVFEKRSRMFMPTDIGKECQRRLRSNKTNRHRSKT